MAVAASTVTPVLAPPAIAEAEDAREAPAGATDMQAEGGGAAAPPLTMGETALLESRKLAEKHRGEGDMRYVFPPMRENELDDFGWQWCLNVHKPPHPNTLPVEALSYKPSADEVFKYFFKGTPKEVCIRQIFFHTPLSEDELEWLAQFRRLCAEKKWAVPYFLVPQLLRILWFCKRKYPDEALMKSLEHAQQMVEWRRGFYPLSDEEPELRELLKLGVMYWVGRDPSLRPLLIVRLSRLPRTTAPDLFKRLTIFCFEWALRFLMVPGVVETCVVLFDVRAVPLHQFPISALTDMVNTLTKQFPFRLHRMWIINDSFFVQTVWSIAKQFLTDVQQQKMKFYRNGFEPELLKEYAPYQLEKHYGGTREELKEFYPFPLAPGPFNIDSKTPSLTPPPEVPMQAVDRFTAFGVIWEDGCRLPTQWSAEAGKIFAANGLPPPPLPTTLEDAATAQALAAVEAATFEARTQSIRNYKTTCSMRKKSSMLSMLHLKSQHSGLLTKDEKAPAAEPAGAAAPGADAFAAHTPEAGELQGEETEAGGAGVATADADTPAAAEAPGLVGGEISRRLSKPAESMRKTEAEAAQREAEAAQREAEAAQREAEAAQREAEAAQREVEALVKQEEAREEPEEAVSHQPPASTPALPERKKSSRLPPAEKVSSKKCCSACTIQ